MMLVRFPKPTPFVPRSTASGVGQTAGGALPVITRIFSLPFRWRLSPAIDGARAPQANPTHTGTKRAPKGETPTFDCNLWPECGCPGGTMRPECPGLSKMASE